MNADSAGVPRAVEALARALAKVPLRTKMDNTSMSGAAIFNADYAARAELLLAALTPSEKLAIAGITEERLGEAILVAAWGYNFDPPDAARIGSDLAPKVLARLLAVLAPDRETPDERR